MISEQARNRWKRFKHLEWLRGEKNRLAVMNARAACIVAYERDAANNTLAANQDRIDLAYICEKTGLSKRAVLRHDAANIKHGIYIRIKHGNNQGKRGGGHSSYTFGPNGAKVEALFKCTLLNVNVQQSVNAQSTCGTLTLKIAGANFEFKKTGVETKRGQEIYTGSDGTRYTVSTVRRKVCSTLHGKLPCRQEVPCVGHRPRYRSVLWPRTYKPRLRTGMYYSPTEAFERITDDWLTDTWLECERCSERVTSRLGHECPKERHYASEAERKASQGRLRKMYADFAKHFNVPDDFGYGATRSQDYIVRRTERRQREYLTPMQRLFLSPAQRLIRAAIDYGFTRTQRGDVLKIAKKIGYNALIEGGRHRSFLADLGDEYGGLNVDLNPFLARARRSPLQQIAKYPEMLDAAMAAHKEMLSHLV